MSKKTLYQVYNKKADILHQPMRKSDCEALISACSLTEGKNKEDYEIRPVK